MDSIYQPKMTNDGPQAHTGRPVDPPTNQPPPPPLDFSLTGTIPPGACISSALANMSVASDRVCNNLELRSSTSWRFSWQRWVDGKGGEVKDGGWGRGVCLMENIPFRVYIYCRCIYIYMCVCDIYIYDVCNMYCLYYRCIYSVLYA